MIELRMTDSQGAQRAAGAHCQGLTVSFGVVGGMSTSEQDTTAWEKQGARRMVLGGVLHSSNGWVIV